MAPCTKCFGLLFAFAPESSIMVTPFAVGNGVAIHGLSIPLMRPSPSKAAATAAPVLPGAMTASQIFSRTNFVATAIEASFFLRNAILGCSCISITSLA